MKREVYYDTKGEKSYFLGLWELIILTKIKICGITESNEAEYLNKNKVDFAGFVLFYPKSKRNISIEKAKSIFPYLNKEIKTVAVTVSPDMRQLKEIETAGFDYIQVHGNLSQELINTAQIPILKAFNEIDTKEYEFYHNCDKITGYVFDAGEPGSGKTFDWNKLKDISCGGKTVILAGGLTPENVKAAIDFVEPDAVDVSSGVEKDRGLGKDPEKIESFVNAVRMRR